jgi:hypothetical protein
MGPVTWQKTNPQKWRVLEPADKKGKTYCSSVQIFKGTAMIDI